MKINNKEFNIIMSILKQRADNCLKDNDIIGHEEIMKVYRSLSKQRTKGTPPPPEKLPF